MTVFVHARSYSRVPRGSHNLTLVGRGCHEQPLDLRRVAWPFALFAKAGECSVVTDSNPLSS
jgi:hypothetical protein